MSTKKHIDYLDDWEKAMACGLMGGRPFSQSTVEVYMLYGRHFLQTYGEVSLQNLKKSLLNTPVAQFAKRYKIFQAINLKVSDINLEEGILTVRLAKWGKAADNSHNLWPGTLGSGWLPGHPGNDRRKGSRSGPQIRGLYLEIACSLC